MRIREFENTDLEQMASLWNASLAFQGWSCDVTPETLQKFIVDKPIFNPRELVFAEESGQLLGFVHFGPDCWAEPEPGYERGFLFMIAVAPDHQRKGVASALMDRAMSELAGKGSKELFAMCSYPYFCFYGELWGPSAGHGVLETNEPAKSLLRKHGFQPGARNICYEKRLPEVRPASTHVLPADIEVAVDEHAPPRQPVEHQLIWYNIDQREVNLYGGGHLVADCLIWMNPGRYGQTGKNVGVIDLVGVSWRHRGRGYGKLLVNEACSALANMGAETAELHVSERNRPARALYEGLGFEPIATAISDWRKQMDAAQ